MSLSLYILKAPQSIYTIPSMDIKSLNTKKRCWNVTHLFENRLWDLKYQRLKKQKHAMLLHELSKTDRSDISLIIICQKRICWYHLNKIHKSNAHLTFNIQAGVIIIHLACAYVLLTEHYIGSVNFIFICFPVIKQWMYHCINGISTYDPMHNVMQSWDRAKWASNLETNTISNCVTHALNNDLNCWTDVASADIVN